MADTKKTGTFQGKSNKLGGGGRAAQMEAQGVPGGVIGDIAREKQAAPGQKNFKGKKPVPPKGADQKPSVSKQAAREKKSPADKGASPNDSLAAQLTNRLRQRDRKTL